MVKQKLTKAEKFLVIVLSVIIIGIGIGCIAIAHAKDLTEKKTFVWSAGSNWETQTPTQFELYWGVVAGGPYTLLATVSYEQATAPPEFSSAVEAVVTGNPGTEETRYFVLAACGDVPQQDGTTIYECSDNSNEVSYTFWIPADQFSIPGNFRIEGKTE